MEKNYTAEIKQGPIGGDHNIQLLAWKCTFKDSDILLQYVVVNVLNSCAVNFMPIQVIAECEPLAFYLENGGAETAPPTLQLYICITLNTFQNNYSLKKSSALVYNQHRDPEGRKL